MIPRPSIPFAAALLLGVTLGVSPAGAPFASAEDAPMAPRAPAAEAPAPPPPPPGRFFDTYDANLDGRVTKEEFSGDLDVFVLLDTDGDGIVTPPELGLPADYKPRPLPKPMDEAGPPGGRDAERRQKFEELRKQFEGWDKDKDGKVTKEEYKGRLPFEVADRNKDGVLSMEDYARGRAGAPGAPGGAGKGMADGAARFKEADRNGDGRVTADEFPGPAERFQAMDRDQDGAITPAEMETALREGAGAGGKRMFQRFDKDGDGKVSRAEFPGNDEGFQAMDRDGDGLLTEAEVAALQGKFAPGGKRPPGGEGKPGPGKPGAGGPGGPMTGEPMPGEPPPGGPMAPPPAGTPGARTPPGGGGAPLGGALFAALDRDRDGRLSRAEFPGTDDEWRRLDRDANGWVTPDEAR